MKKIAKTIYNRSQKADVQAIAQPDNSIVLSKLTGNNNAFELQIISDGSAVHVSDPNESCLIVIKHRNDAGNGIQISCKTVRRALSLIERIAPLDYAQMQARSTADDLTAAEQAAINKLLKDMRSGL
jgi:hypothetical protein